MPFKFGRKQQPVSGPSATADVAQETVTFDPAYGVPAVALARSQYLQGDWRSIEDAHGESEDWDLRAGIAQTLADLDPSEDWIARCPTSGFGQAVLAAQIRRMAWDIRGGGKASSVPKSAWGDFFETVDEAEQASWRATQLAPEDPYPWSQLIWSGMGLQIPKDEILWRFGSMQERDPGHYYGWHAVISATAQKWGGSHELMFDVAQQGARDLPEGSLGRVGILRAHEERRLYMADWDNETDASHHYFRRPDVAADISNAASHSVFADRQDGNASTRPAASWFAYGLAMIGDGVRSERVRAANVFLALGETGIPAFPWVSRYGSRGPAQYVRIRKLCLDAADAAFPDSP